MAGAAYTCLKCGRQFARKPAGHICARYKVAPLLKGKEPRVLAVYRRLISPAKSCGPLHVSALKTTVVLSAPAAMARVTPQKSKLKVLLVLPGVREHPTLRSRHRMSMLKSSHEFSFAAEQDLDGDFAELVRGAWALGSGGNRGRGGIATVGAPGRPPCKPCA